jgi:integrating conjugative element protein (TIGR03756 family)
MGWASGIPEIFSLDALTGRRVMGTAAVRFGSIYPRTGWSVHAEDPKSAALTAQRAADLVTGDRRAARVYQPVGTDCGNRCWAPPPVKENDSSTHRWQMLTPVKQSNEWEIFGQRSGWAHGKYHGSERYAWNLWRPYSCCAPQGAYLFSVNWE